MKTLKNQRGMVTLTELLFVMVIMTMIAVAVMDVVMGTVRTVLLNAQQNVAETGARNVVQRIAEDIRMAGGGVSANPFLSGSDGTHVYITRNGKNMDAFSVPNNGDNQWDIACYAYYPPVGTRGNANYKPGRIEAGATSGGPGICAANDMVQLSDTALDVMDFKISYCRPAPGVPGTFTCNQTITEPGTLINNSDCVWMVRLNIKTKRVPNYSKDLTGPEVSYSTSVRPRMIYLTSLGMDENKNTIVDCCEAVYTGSDVDWCPLSTRK